ncbi:LysR family transcriptional regulator [Paenibacillus ginsengarvi]|uniref:LysR family transcriptional regulator n=1 Tax=Paenibacillus ginsengarvi TaxID=400777 RepID=A0A3B0CL85_9BACL|nr:LysR family transcriptional regulator [Paenibacillus ginsengarvi]RKN85117.1 LysR family transcriptional regulator [Paenibacillus ginsengarvi]
MELYRIFYFTALAGSISKAAKQLHMTQPSASLAIKQLEGALQLNLFVRTPKGVELTVDGKMLFSFVEQAYGLISSAEKKMGEVVNLNSGEVRIGASDSTIRFVLLPFLKEFGQQYPGVKIKLVTGSTLGCLQHLRDGTVDFCLVRTPVDDNMMTSVNVLTVQDCFVAGEKYRSVCENAISLKQLLQYPLIVFPLHMTSRKTLSHFFAAHGLTLQPAFEIGSRDILIDFAKAGLGISCVVKQFIQEELKAGILYEVKLEQPLPMIHFGIVRLKEAPLSVAANQFIELVVNAYSQDAPC